MFDSATATKPKKKGDKKSNLTKKLRKAMSDMPEALRDEISAIMSDVAALDSDDIQRRYGIGKRLNATMNDNTGKYGVDAKRTIQEVLRLARDSVAHMARVAAGFTQTDMDKLQKIHNPVNNERLRWNHIVHLTKVPDKEKAFEFARKAIDHGWTTKDLGKAIIRSAGGPKSQGGRKPKRHESLDDSMSDLIAKMKGFSNSAESVWLAPKGAKDQFEVLAASPDYKPTMELLRQLSEGVDQVQRLSMQVALLTNMLMLLKGRAESIRALKTAKVA